MRDTDGHCLIHTHTHICTALLLAHLGYALLLHHIVLLHRRRKSNVELVLLESVEEFELLFVLCKFC